MARDPQGSGAANRSRNRGGRMDIRRHWRPCGVHNLPEEGLCVGRAYFARSPESDIWVCFDDLPEMVRDALWDRHSAKLAFPAGLEALPRQTASDLERE